MTLTGEAGFNTTLKNFISLGLGGSYVPWNTYDFYEPRVDDYKFRIPKNYGVNGFISTDYRKAIAIDFSGEYNVVPEWNNVEIAALVKLDAGPDQAARRSGYRQGREVNVAFLFVDLRGSTKLSEERLLFNVVLS